MKTFVSFIVAAVITVVTVVLTYLSGDKDTFHLCFTAEYIGCPTWFLVYLLTECKYTKKVTRYVLGIVMRHWVFLVSFTLGFIEIEVISYFSNDSKVMLYALESLFWIVGGILSAILVFLRVTEGTMTWLETLLWSVLSCSLAMLLTVLAIFGL